MASRIYASGVRATAITNMVADVGAFIVAQIDGTKGLNTSALRAYMDAQIIIAAGDGGADVGVTSAMIAASLRTFDVTRFIDQLDNAVRKERFMGRADWPKSYGTVTGAYLVGAIKTAISEAQTLSDIVTAHYAGLANQNAPDLLNAITTLYNESDIDSTIPDGVQRIVNTRTYLYCYRTDKGEISAPSPASALAEVDQNDTMNLTAEAPPVGRFIDAVLWYRSNSSHSDDAFQFLDEVPISSGLTYNDSKIAEALREPCPSFDWLVPPTNLRGMKSHPNGFGVGFYDNTVCFSVANRFYAWPSAYRKTTRTPIVGLGIFGTTVFVGTKGEPVLMTGTDPAFMSAERVNGGQACRSARSIVSTTKGIVYAGADGIVLCNGLGETPVLTRDHFTKEFWETLNPSSIHAIEHDGCYYFWWTNGGSSGCYSLGLDTGRLVTVDLVASSVFLNPDDDTIYAMNGTGISKVFGGTGRRTATWKSPRIAGSAVNFSWKKVAGDFEQGALTIKWMRYFINSAGVQTTDTITHTVANRKASRLPPGRPDEYELELSGKSAATLLAVATDVNELKSV